MELFYAFDDEEIPAMVDGSGLAEAMLGLDGVRVTGVSEADGEVTVEIETTEPAAWGERCVSERSGRQATAAAND